MDKTQASVLTADFFEVKNYHLFEYDTKRSEYPPFEIFNDTNSAYYSWLTTFNELEVVAKEIYINLPGEDILKINESFEEKYQMAYIKNTHKSTPIFFFDSYFHCFDTICSLITKDGPVRRGEWINYETFNFDTERKMLMSNDELLETLNVEKEEIGKILEEELKNLGLTVCNNPSDKKPCVYNSTNLPTNRGYYITAEINDDSLLILNDQGKLEILFSVENIDNFNMKPYNGNTTPVLYPIQLTE